MILGYQMHYEEEESLFPSITLHYITTEEPSDKNTDSITN